VFYSLTHTELAGRRPLAKFLCIKLIVMFTFYQSFVFSLLQGRVIHATQFWTTTNITDGLNALAICIEMVFFALLMVWAYPASEYKQKGVGRTSIWRPLWDSINFSDFAREIWSSLVFFVDYIRRKPYARSSSYKAEGRRMDFGEAFGLEDNDSDVYKSNGSSRLRGGGNGRSGIKPYISTPIPLDNGDSRMSTGLPRTSGKSMYANGAYGNDTGRGRGWSGEYGNNNIARSNEYDDDVRLTTYTSRHDRGTDESGSGGSHSLYGAPGVRQAGPYYDDHGTPYSARAI